VSPRKDGRPGGIVDKTSGGGSTGRCAKWDFARSNTCFESWPNESRLMQELVVSTVRCQITRVVCISEAV
jgi:hypothetical protein